MNQFKMAKKKAIENGHQIENAGDLKTAGVKQPLTDAAPKETAEEEQQEPAAITQEAEPVVSNVTEPVQPEASLEPEPIVKEIIPEPAPQQPQPAEPTYINAPTVSEYTQPVQQPQLVYTQPVQEIQEEAPAYAVHDSVSPYNAAEITTRKGTSGKKNIPNIFSPKGEAKSMRKSLVLKPTSVKIAENYCAKNGGSFNELIQTLLDNFIDEYGL